MMKEAPATVELLKVSTVAGASFVFVFMFAVSAAHFGLVSAGGRTYPLGQS